MDRRAFIRTLASATAGLMLTGTGGGTSSPRDRLGSLLPLRRLGKTGEGVTMLGLGGFHLGDMSERDAQETIEAALEGGVRFFDSAESYQSGGSESRYGKLLVPKYRDVIFLMTKTGARDAATARRDLEASLGRLGTDRLDLWQMHSMASAQDVDARLRDGVLDVMLEARASGRVRFIGFTGHRTPLAHRRMLEKSDAFETCQIPVNPLDPGYLSFTAQILPALIQKKLGVLAMKTLAGGGFFSRRRPDGSAGQPVIPDRMSVADALRFVWSLPVSVLITGPDNAAQLREKIALARDFTAMDEQARGALVDRAADLAGKHVEWYKA